MVKRTVSELKPYNAAGHFNMTAMRVQGKEESGATKFWMGLSHFLPGGGADFDASPTEKIYYVLSGNVVVTDKDGNKIELGPNDSLFIGANEGRSLLNESNMPASMLVVINYPN